MTASSQNRQVKLLRLRSFESDSALGGVVPEEIGVDPVAIGEGGVERGRIVPDGDAEIGKGRAGGGGSGGGGGGGEAAERRRFFVAVHVGAGYHSPSNEKPLRLAMKRACLAAASLLRKGSGGCLDAVSAAIQVLEDDPITNAGRGSNLTEDGHIECDASIMDGTSGAFGAVGAVPDQVSEVLFKLLLY